MSESNHTQGEWVAKQLYYDTGCWVVLFPDTSKGGVHQMRLDNAGMFKEEDARLIAAAPKMLAVLENIQHCISTKGFAEIHHGSLASSDISNAIKQAKGDK